MTVKVTNNGFSTLASGINNSVTTIALASGEGARFPNPSSPDVFYATLIDTSNNLEVVKVTARSTDSLTVVRAQDNTSARAFSTGDRFELRPVAKLFEDIQAEARDLNGAELILDADADTSIHASTDDQIDFKTGGTDRMKIDASGNTTVLGTDSTLISGEGTGDRDFSTDTFGTIDIPSFSLMNQVTDSAKNISGLGMNFTNGVLGIVNNYQYTGGGKIAYYTGTKTSTGGSLTEAMRIDAEGQMLFGGITSELTNNGGCLQLKSRTGSEHCATFRNGVSDGGFGINFQRVDGTQVGSIAWTSSVTNFNTSSDYRLKENVTYTFDATTEVKKLKPCKFNFKDESDTVEGFLAHEVSSIVPLAVTGTKDAKDSNDNPIYQSIDQSKLVPLLVKTIQEQQAVIEDLQSRVTTLEG